MDSFEKFKQKYGYNVDTALSLTALFGTEAPEVYFERFSKICSAKPDIFVRWSDGFKGHLGGEFATLSASEALS